jgi:hypothetical protein
MSRLSPAAARFDRGARGGIPEYTGADVAAAIGMVSDSFAREVFCAVWWPEGARLVRRELDAMIANLQYAEWRARAEAWVEAQLAEALALHSSQSLRSTAKHFSVEGTQARMWPSLCNEVYSAIRSGVIAELRAPRSCHTCSGRGVAKSEDLIIVCKSCDGSGRTSISDSARARMLERNQTSYCRSWKAIYEWTYAKVSDAESAGRAEVARRLD